MPRPKSPPPQSELKKKNNVIKELQFALMVPFINATNPTTLEIALRERIKELNCLYGISFFSEHYSDSIDDLLRNLVDLLPASWQYPEITYARIVFNGKTYKSRGFKVTKWRQSSQIFMYNQPAGEVEVFYLRGCPTVHEGPFLKEERVLIDAIAERIGKIAIRISAEKELRKTNKQLKLKHEALQKTNTALRTLLTKLEEEKRSIYENIQSNVEKILMPILNTLSLELSGTHGKHVDLLRSNLEELSSPFINHLSRNFLSLTPTEIKICNMIRSGLRTKEIAQMQGVSMATINCHREHIRQKLKITNKEINLTTFLQSNM